MTWQPGPRPEWVGAIDRGEVPPISDVALRPLDRDLLLAEARARLGLDDDAGVGAIDGDDGFLEPLDLVLRALEDEARLTVTGRWITRRFVLRLLEVRFHIAAYLAADPGVRDEHVRAPIVVTGAPRTGTTILFGTMDRDPSLRAPEGWELLRPVPPPAPDGEPDEGRLALADRELRMMGAASSGLDAIHEYTGRMPKECLSAMSFEFLTEEFTARYHVPTYARYLETCDMGPAYRMHRLVLQILQRRGTDVQWLLKSPVHLHSLPTLYATYPDARVVVTHRDPLTLLPSVTSLVCTLRRAHSDDVDFAAVGGYHEAKYWRDLDGLATADEGGSIDGHPVSHVLHTDFTADPIGVVRRVYDDIGLDLDPGAERAMVDYLAARPKGVHGTHEYSFADLGLDAAAERERFARYQAHFGVLPEVAT